jgi:hypothetical protein
MPQFSAIGRSPRNRVAQRASPEGAKENHRQMYLSSYSISCRLSSAINSS